MIQTYFDGSCFPSNPGGHMACAILISTIEKDGVTIELAKRSKFFKSSSFLSTSNNLAEYLAFKAILQYLINNNLQKEKIMVYGDSQLVINQIFGTWKIKDGAYKDVAIKSKNLLNKFRSIHGFWIPEKQNYICHNLCIEIQNVYRRHKDIYVKEEDNANHNPGNTGA